MGSRDMEILWQPGGWPERDWQQPCPGKRKHGGEKKTCPRKNACLFVSSAKGKTREGKESEKDLGVPPNQHALGGSNRSISQPRCRKEGKKETEGMLPWGLGRGEGELGGEVFPNTRTGGEQAGCV